MNWFTAFLLIFLSAIFMSQSLVASTDKNEPHTKCCCGPRTARPQTPSFDSRIRHNATRRLNGKGTTGANNGSGADLTKKQQFLLQTHDTMLTL